MSIKALLKITPKLTFQCDGETEAELMEEMSRVEELFSSTKCGVCNCERIKYVCRLDKDEHKWLELVCQNSSCRAKLSYGVTKKGGKIFPKTRWDHLSETVQKERPEDADYAAKHNGWLPHFGWHIYKPKEANK